MREKKKEKTKEQKVDIWSDNLSLHNKQAHQKNLRLRAICKLTQEFFK